MVTQSKIHKTVMKQIFWRLNSFLIFSRSFIDPNVPKENQNNPENMEETLVSAMKETISTKELVDENGGIEMEYEIDVETEQFEMTQMPKLSHGIYLHDFRVCTYL